MTEILNTIDAALAEQCACGCGLRVPPDGASAWFVDADCQQRWAGRRATDPDDVYRRPDAYLHADAEALHRMSTSLAHFVEQVRSAFATMQPALIQVAELVTACQPDQDGPTDPMERALWLRRNRNTGPRRTQRAPRRIDPGWTP